MDNNFDNIPENNEKQQEQQPYTYYQSESSDKKDYQQQYQDNYNYNVGNNTGYNTSYDTGMDTTPLTMGEWLLTIFLLSIPCVNIVLYCVWAFGKNGNINRRNYCRAGLILVAIGYVIAIIIAVIAGIATATAGSLYY